MSAETTWWHNPVFVGFIAAAIALVGNVVVTVLQTESAERQVHQKNQSELVVEAIKTGDPALAAKNLRFLLDHGLLDDPDGKLRASLSEPDKVPYLPSSGFGQGGFGMGPYGGKQEAPPDRPPK